MSENIPFEIQEEIMKRLPVKALLQFRSVSKAWKSLIDSYEFIAAHSVSHTQPHRLLVSYEDSVTGVKNCVSFVDDDSFPHQKSAPAVPLSVELLRSSRIVGSSHGLLCLYGYGQHPNFGLNPRTDIAALWNPSIRKSVAIPVSIVLFETVLGFGVCPFSTDPKIVKITLFGLGFEKESETSYHWKVEVYTLSSGKWRSLSNNLSNNLFKVTWSQVVIDRFIYWFAFGMVAIDGRVQVYVLIISFDMTSEKFIVVDLPDSLTLRGNVLSSIFKLKESLAVLENLSNIEEQKVCAVWVMKHGVQNSFTKLFIVKEPCPWLRTLGSRNSGDLIMDIHDVDEDCSKLTGVLVVYEPDSEEINDLGIRGQKSSCAVISYMETLLLLGWSDCVSC